MPLNYNLNIPQPDLMGKYRNMLALKGGMQNLEIGKQNIAQNELAMRQQRNELAAQPTPEEVKAEALFEKQSTIMAIMVDHPEFSKQLWELAFPGTTAPELISEGKTSTIKVPADDKGTMVEITMDSKKMSDMLKSEGFTYGLLSDPVGAKATMAAIVGGGGSVTITPAEKPEKSYFTDPAKLVDDTHSHYNTEMRGLLDEFGFVKEGQEEIYKDVVNRMNRDLQLINQGKRPMWLTGETPVTTPSQRVGEGLTLEEQTAIQPQVKQKVVTVDGKKITVQWLTADKSPEKKAGWYIKQNGKWYAYEE